MKISTKGRYALRLMLDLAVYNTGEPISLKDVAKRQNISEKYMEQIISVLNKAGFVRGILRCAGGISAFACTEGLYSRYDLTIDGRRACPGCLCWTKSN